MESLPRASPATVPPVSCKGLLAHLYHLVVSATRTQAAPYAPKSKLAWILALNLLPLLLREN